MMLNKNLSAKRMNKAAVILTAMLLVTACSSPTEKADKFYREGVQKLEKGELAKARIEFQNAVQIKPKLVSAWYGLAQIAEKEADFPKLFGLLQKVVELDPKHLEAQIKYGRLLLVAGKLDRALETSNTALALSPDDLAAQSLKAAVLFKLNDVEAALSLANAVLAKDEKYVDALVILAMDKIAAGDSEKAIEYLDKGIAQNEKNLALQLMKIKALSNLKRDDNAIEIYKKLIVLYPESNELKLGLAELYYKLARTGDAEQELRNIVKLNPDNVQYVTNLLSFIQTTQGAEAAKKELQALVTNNPKNLEYKFLLVNFYKETKQTQLAEALLNDVVKAVPDSKDAIKAKAVLATIAMEAGDKTRAGDLVAQVLEKDKNNEQALIIKASMLMEQSDLENAIATLRIILRDAPNSSRALFLLAKSHELAGSTALAEEHYLRAFQTSKMSGEFGVPYAQFLLKRGQVSRAEKTVEDILGQTPNHVPTKRLLAQIKITQGDMVGAQKVADELRKFGNSDVSEQIMGVIFATKKNYAESISSFQRAYNAAPDDIQPLAGLVKTYLLAGKVKEASDFLDNVLKANPKNVNAKLLKSQLLVLSGDKEKAIEVYNQLVNEKSDNAEVYQQLANAHVHDNKLIEAEKVIKLGLTKVPTNFSLQLSQAAIYEMTNRYDAAISAYDAMLKQRPDAEVIVNNYASLLAERKNDKKSFEHAYTLAQRFKNSEIPQFKDTLAWSAYRVGKYDEALAQMKVATEKMPELAIFHYHLGHIYLAKQDKPNAKRAFEQVLKLTQKNNFEYYDEVSDLVGRL